MIQAGRLRPTLRLHGTQELPRTRAAALLLAFALAFLLAARLGTATGMPPQGVVILWPANAIVLLALLHLDRSRWWLILLATLAAEVAADGPTFPLWAALGYGLVNFAEAAIAALLLARFARHVPPLLGARDFVLFLAAGPILAAGVAALGGAAVFKMQAPEIVYFHYWRVFWLGDAVGLLIVGTALLAWRRPDPWLGRLGARRAAEAAALSLGLLAATARAFLAPGDTPVVYLVFPFLMWAALRFGVRGASVAVLATVAIGTTATVHGSGPFAQFSQVDTVVALQGLIAVIAVSTYLLAFAVEDSWRRTRALERSLGELRDSEAKLTRAHEELRKVNANLDGMVAERTEHLREALSRNRMLLREVHHRIKNNLNIISGLIALQTHFGRGTAADGLMAKVQGQIHAIASTYDALQQLDSVESADLAHVLPMLCRNIQQTSGGLTSITTRVEGPAPLPADTAVSLSLALNELVTNCAKHAVPGRTVSVDVTCRREGDRILLSVVDDGPGLPAGFDPATSGEFGMRMMRTLIAQAGGTLRFERRPAGTAVEVEVPVAPPSDASAADATAP
jgi:two-component sensor histidine kinase/integral membrane sensor domain MASE1